MSELSSRELRVLHEDNHLIAVYKPSGVLTQGDRTGDASLMDTVKAWLRERYDKPGQVFLGLVHRLDRPVSGVVLFAKTSKAASRLSQQFRERTVDKRYLARLEGVIAPPAGRLSCFMAQREGERRVLVSDRALPDTKPASLLYDTQWWQRDACIVNVTLETGRKHQIRAQLAHVGHPIVGDRRYGARAQLSDDAIALCAVRLTVAHPIAKQALTIALPNALLPTLLQQP
ncbi:MAG: RluA family pseudouridine synthase [Polyangiales bacterium]